MVRGITNTKIFIKILVTITFLCMVAVNAAADIIPINGVTTGEVSEKYKNLFTPAGFTFAIWGLIYFMLLLYTLYSLGFFHRGKNIDGSLLNEIGLYFSISSVANIGWILAWHYFNIPLSMLLMVIILVCLIIINSEINKFPLTKREQFFLSLPFSIYFGWITVATIANASALLVSLNWNGFGLLPEVWTVIILFVGAAIGLVTEIINKDIAYGLTLIWGYTGILVNHVWGRGYDREYPQIIISAAICIAFFTIITVFIIFIRNSRSNILNKKFSDTGD